MACGRLTAPEHDADAFADVLKDPAIAGFDVTVLVNEPHYVVGEAIADFYGGGAARTSRCSTSPATASRTTRAGCTWPWRNTRRDALTFTAISGAQLNDAMDASRSRRKVLILDCCYSGAFPAGRTAKSDEGVQTLERFQGKGRAVLTASDATQYAFEGDDLRGSGTGPSSVFTRHLVEAISSGAADLDEDGDIALDELYSYVYDRVVAEVPQQRPKKQEDVDGRILIARNVHWRLPGLHRARRGEPHRDAATERGGRNWNACTRWGNECRPLHGPSRTSPRWPATTAARCRPRRAALLERIGGGGGPPAVRCPSARHPRGCCTARGSRRSGGTGGRAGCGGPGGGGAEAERAEAERVERLLSDVPRRTG